MYNFVQNNAVNAWDVLGEAPRLYDVDWHHLVPKQFANKLPAGFLDSADNGWLFHQKDHRALHSAGWNEDWKKFFDGKSSVTIADLKANLNSLKSSSQYSSFFEGGMKARVSYKSWGGASVRMKVFKQYANKMILKKCAKKTGEAIVGAIPIASFFISLSSYEARASDYGKGTAFTMTVIDNVPLADISLSIAEYVDQKRKIEEEFEREFQQVLMQLEDIERKENSN
ncbi:MAG: hypothetical protein ACRC37_03885 [Lentisphaeria bacterium]